MPRKVFSSQAYRHKVVLVSGGCSGIGRALALRFARAGARLAILDLDQAALDSLVQHLRDHLGGEALGLRCDVADADAVERAVALAVERFGGIDVLVNNAGITHRGTFAETGLGVFRKVMAVNFFGAVHCTRAALPSLLERRGQIVVLGSLTGFAPLLYRSAYNASKHALHGLFDTLRMELEGTGVSVTLACPGFTAADLRKNALVGDGSVTRAGASAGQPGGIAGGGRRGDLPGRRAAPAPAGAVQRQLAGAAAGALLSASLRKAAGAAPVGTQAATLTVLSGRGRGRRSPGSCPSRRPRPCARRGRG